MMISFFQEEHIDGNRDMTFKKENGNRDLIEEDTTVICLRNHENQY